VSLRFVVRNRFWAIAILLAASAAVAPLASAGSDPDLAVSKADISFTPSNPQEHQPFLITALVRNVGNATGNATVRFTIDPSLFAGDTSLSAEASVSVGVGGASFVSSNFSLKAGVHIVEIRLLNATPPDRNPSNDVAYATFEVFPIAPRPRPDLAVFDGGLSFSPTEPREGEDVVMTARILNLGNATGSGTVRFLVDPFGPGPILAAEATATVAPGDATGVTVIVSLATGTHAVEVTIVNATPEDANWSNNAAKGTLDVGASPPSPPNPSGLPWASALVLGAAIAIIGTFGAVETERYRLLGFFLPLYTRLRKEDLLEQYTRGKIHGFLLANPGEHFSAIGKALGVSSGNLAYHLTVLEREGLIASKREGTYRRFYPPGARLAAGDGLTLVQRAVWEVVRDAPGINQKGIAAVLGTTPAALSRHLHKLEGLGFIEAKRAGMSVRYRSAGLKEPARESGTTGGSNSDSHPHASDRGGG